MCKVAFAIQNQRYFSNEAVYSQSYYRVSIETCVRRIDWWQIWRPMVNFGQFSGSKIFPQRISHTFCRRATKFGSVRDWPIATYSPNFVNFGPEVSWYHAVTCISPLCKVFFSTTSLRLPIVLVFFLFTALPEEWGLNRGYMCNLLHAINCMQ